MRSGVINEVEIIVDNPLAMLWVVNDFDHFGGRAVIIEDLLATFLKGFLLANVGENDRVLLPIQLVNLREVLSVRIVRGIEDATAKVAAPFNRAEDRSRRIVDNEAFRRLLRSLADNGSSLEFVRHEIDPFVLEVRVEIEPFSDLLRSSSLLVDAEILPEIAVEQDDFLVLLLDLEQLRAQLLNRHVLILDIEEGKSQNSRSCQFVFRFDNHLSIPFDFRIVRSLDMIIIYFNSSVKREFGRVCNEFLSGFLAAIMATASDGVQDIIRLRLRYEMIGIDARFAVADMADDLTVGDRAVEHKIRSLVRVYHASAEPELTVSARLAMLRAYPRPASDLHIFFMFRQLDELHEAVNVGFGNLIVKCKCVHCLQPFVFCIARSLALIISLFNSSVNGELDEFLTRFRGEYDKDN
jgi:hypothetical protein